MSSSEQAFFVATNGNDSWSGRLAAPNADGTDGPFATLDRARDAMRGSDVKTTYVRGGTYRFGHTVTLGAADSGVSILGFPGETPVFSGGQAVGGFADIGGGLYAASPGAATGLDLSIGGVRQKVAQSGDWNAGDPRSGWSVLEQAASGPAKTALRYRADDPIAAQIPAIQPGTLIQTFDTEHLADDIVAVAGVDPASRTISFAKGVRYALRSGGTFRLLNDDRFIRDPGEFAWRAEDGRLVVRPQDPGALLSQGAVVARLGTLLALDGANGVTIQGLTFADTLYNATALTVRNGGDTRIAGNRFTNVGTAITLTGAPRTIVEGNRLEQLGASGIQVTYGSSASLIAGNTITDAGMVLKDVAGVSVYGANDTVIRGNDIRGSARYGISIKNWDAATVNVGTVVEYNRLYDTMRETADGGAIEMLGRSDIDTRTAIRGNDIRTVGGYATDASGSWLSRYKSFGIYLDDQANGVAVTDNLVADTGWASVFVHGGDANRIENNFALLGNPRERFIRLEWVPNAGEAGRLKDNGVTRNVVVSATGQDYWEFWTPGSYSVTGNLLQGTRKRDGGDVTGGAGLFLDPGSGDFRLNPASGAAALGIHDLDWARMGFAPATVPAVPVPPATGTVTSPGPVSTGGGAAAGIDGLAYIASYADLSAAFGPNAAQGVAHYIANGRAEGRSVGFDPLAYTASYTDLSAAFGTDQARAAAHYITNGRAEGRGISFDPLAYAASYADLAAAFGTNRTQAAAHYIANGRAEGRSVTFDPLAYLASYADLSAAFGTDRTLAATHYLANGRAEGRGVSFDPLAYVAANPDLAAAFGTDRTRAELHYLANGRAEGRRTGFDAAAYLAANPDVAAAAGGDLSRAMQHYVAYGRLEGRALGPAARSAGMAAGMAADPPAGGLLAAGA